VQKGYWPKWKTQQLAGVIWTDFCQENSFLAGKLGLGGEMARSGAVATAAAGAEF
jgi:hypothetical protein